jgi:hypothetical protein
MKMPTNLAGYLRAIFSALRLATISLAALWVLMLTYNAWIQKRHSDGPNVGFTFGEVSLAAAPNAVALVSDTAKPGSLELSDLRGKVKVDLCSSDSALVSAIYWSAIPAMAVATAFLVALFGSLRGVCANIERGEVFSERNLLLVRRVGWIFVANSVAGFAAAIWAAYEVGGYLNRHVALTGIGTGPLHPGGAGAASVEMASGTIPFSGPGGLLIGLLVLTLGEAFRKGLALKTENDLTV